jgi:hypothetical protein
MRKKMIWLAPLAILAMAAFIAIGGEVVLHLWNWLLPALFGWRQITFWQAVGLLALCRILFGGVSGRGFHRPNYRQRMAEHWKRLEERRNLRQVMCSATGGFGPPTSGTKESA